MDHWYLMTIRLMFAFLFQWTVSASGRILAWIIPDRPRSLDLKIKRQEFLAKDALRKYKIKIGKRQPEIENLSEEEDEVVEDESDLLDLTKAKTSRDGNGGDSAIKENGGRNGSSNRKKTNGSAKRVNIKVETNLPNDPQNH